MKPYRPFLTRIILLAALSAIVSVPFSIGQAQEGVEAFLKPHTTNKSAIFAGPKDPVVPYKRVCTQPNDETISCRTFVAKLPSGGGTWFGPWYEVVSDPPPVGYRFQSASFSLPMLDASGKRVSAPDFCYGDGNSPMVAADSEAAKQGKPYRQGNPDTQYMGHKNGAEHAHAVCYIDTENPSGVKWHYNLQGEEGGCSAQVWPFAKDNSHFSMECRRDGAVSEPAELDVVYVKATK